MKKILAVILSLSMCACMLASCDEDSSSKDSSSKADSSVTDSSATDSSEGDSSKDDSSEAYVGVKHDVKLDGHEISFGEAWVDSTVTADAIFAGFKDSKAKYESTTTQMGVEMLVTCMTDGNTSRFDITVDGKVATIIRNNKTNDYYVADFANKKYAELPEEDAFDFNDQQVVEHYKQMPDFGAYIETVKITLDGKEYVAEYFDSIAEQTYIVFDESDGEKKWVTTISNGMLINEVGVATFYVPGSDVLEVPSDFTQVDTEEMRNTFAEILGGGSGDITDKPSDTDSRYDDLKELYLADEKTIELYLLESDNVYPYFYYTTNGSEFNYYIEYDDGSIANFIQNSDGFFFVDEQNKTYSDGTRYIPSITWMCDTIDSYFSGTFKEETEVEIEGKTYSADAVDVDGEEIIFVYDELDEFIAILVEDSTGELVTLPGEVTPETVPEYLIIPDDFTEIPAV